MMIPAWISSETTVRLVTMLLHTLWQGAALAGLLYALLRVIPAAKINRRYVACVLALAGVVLCGFVTWAVLGHESAAGVPKALAINPEVMQGPIKMPTSAPDEGPALHGETSAERPSAIQSKTWAAWAVGIWVVGVLLMLIRLSVMALGANRLRRQCRALENAAVSAALRRLRTLLRVGRKVGIACSESILVPMVIGILRPTILLPMSLVSGVPVGQIEAVLAHELAHIRRYDYLVNLGQMVIEALLFFNPAVWWFSRQIRTEREACCDALAEGVAATENGYARALVDVAERLASGATQPRMAMALTGPEQGSDFLERIRRLAVPFHRPIPKLPWHGLIGALVAAGLLLTALWCGTTVAVEKAAKLFTPEERIKELARIDKEFGHKDSRAAEKVTISGTVRTHDGKPLPKELLGRIIILSLKRRAWSELWVKKGRFSTKTHYGRQFLYLNVPGYAPAFAGPFFASPGDKVKDVEIVLKPGFVAKIRVIDTKGNPIPGAQLKGQYVRAPHDEIDIWQQLTTDKQGIVTINHCLDWPVKLRATAQGYEVASQKKLHLEAGAVFEWMLKPARATTGIVLSRETGKPVAGAVIRLIERAGPAPRIYSLKEPDKHIVGHTADDGTFTITSLRRDSQYVFLVEAPGIGCAFLRSVSAGDTGLKVELGPEIYIRGKVIGSLKEIQELCSRPTLAYRQSYMTLRNTKSSAHKNLCLKLKNGEAFFEIRNRWPGTIWINVGKKRVQLDLTKSIDDLVIDLTPPKLAVEDKIPMRDVVIRFSVPDGAPAPTGEIEVAHAFQDGGAIRYTKRAIRNGEVLYSVPVPCFLFYKNKNIVGYSFKQKFAAKVPVGKEPFMIAVKLVPAGAIYGSVVNADGAPAIGASVNAIMVEKESSIKRSFVGHKRFRLGVQGKFNLGSLPLGGTYVIVARNINATHVLSKKITLSTKQPMAEIQLKFPEGVLVNGQILAPDGRPVAGVRCGLSYTTPYGHRFGHGLRPTNAEGRFSMEHINPDIPGTHTLKILPYKDFQPLGMKIEPNAKPLTIRLKKGCVLTGRVIDDATGKPMAGMNVHAAFPNWYSMRLGTSRVNTEQPTNRKGEFRFSNLPVGVCNLYIEGHWLKHNHPDVRITKGDNAPITLRVLPPGKTPRIN